MSLKALKNEKIAFFSSILFIANPASVFFNSMYTESVFFCFTLFSIHFYLKVYYLKKGKKDDGI